MYSNNPHLYQLLGPIEDLYQIVPIGHHQIDNGNVRNEQFQFQQRLPYFEDSPEITTLHEFNENERRLQLVGPIGIEANGFLIFDEDLYQLAPPNELEAPIQLLAIEGPPQFQIVGPVPQLARIRCRFANSSSRMVDLVWTDDNNRMYRYAKLAREEFVDITTFEGHQWIFCDALDGELYLISPGLIKKFIATSEENRKKQSVNAVRLANDFSLRKIALRILTHRLFNVWNCIPGAGEQQQQHFETTMNLLIRSMRLPLYIQVQLAEFVLSCILYQIKFASNCGDPLSRQQQRMFKWLVHFVQTNTRRQL